MLLTRFTALPGWSGVASKSKECKMQISKCKMQNERDEVSISLKTLFPRIIPVERGSKGLDSPGTLFAFILHFAICILHFAF
jgi:hypothetical protein